MFVRHVSVSRNFTSKRVRKLKENSQEGPSPRPLSQVTLTRADVPGSLGQVGQGPATSPGPPLQPRSFLAPSPPPQDAAAGLGLPLVVQGSPHPRQLPARTYARRSGQREPEGWTPPALAGSELLPELGKAGLSRTRQALGEGAQRDRTQLGGGATVTKGSSGTVEPRSSGQRGRLKAHQATGSRPRDPALGSPGSLRPLSPPSQQIPLPPGGGVCKPTSEAGPTCSPQDPNLLSALRSTAWGDQGGGAEPVLRGLFFLINEHLRPHAMSCNPA